MDRIKAKFFKSKRFKLIEWATAILFLPISLPLFLLIEIGELAEDIYHFVERIHRKFLINVIKLFKLESFTDRKKK